MPMLQAEEDRDAYRRQMAAMDREKEIMKHVKDWDAGKSVYNNGSRYTPPTFAVLPPFIDFLRKYE